VVTAETPRMAARVLVKITERGRSFVDVCNSVFAGVEN
jgi:hypothetical protein